MFWLDYLVACNHSSSSPAESLWVSPLSALYWSCLSSIESPTCGNILSERGGLSTDCTLSHWKEDGGELTRLAQGSSSIDEWNQLWLRSMPLPPPPPRPPPPRPRKPPADAGVPGVLGWLPKKQKHEVDSFHYALNHFFIVFDVYVQSTTT